MRATLPYVKERFEAFNREIFEESLPPITIMLSDAKSYLGQITYKRQRQLNGKIRRFNFCMRISRRMDISEQELEDTIIHEMIHYYISINNLKDSSSHGTLFKSMMNSINRRFNRAITVSHKATAAQRESALDTTPRYRVIAVATFHDGHTGLKVLPRVASSIIRFYNEMIRCGEIAGVRLFVCNAPFFNRFPASSALRVHILPFNEFERHLENADEMVCKGNCIVRRFK